MPELDAVLPLLPRDCARFGLLARSLERYMEDLGTLWVVVPDDSADSIRERIQSVELPLEVIGESEWAPHLDQLPLRGWYKQQLVKLAACGHVRGEFFLTLDADVLCTRRCGYEELVPQGRARCFVMTQSDHQNWYDGAEAALGLRAARRGVLHNVTPVVWSTSGVRQTVQHLSKRADARHWAAGSRGWRQRANALFGRSKAAPWMRYLCGATPWAEYALYFTYLEANGKFERYHTESDVCIYDVERSLWKNTKNLDGWDPSPLFSKENGPPFFAVLQSNAGLSVDELWRRLEPWLGSRNVSGE